MMAGWTKCPRCGLVHIWRTGGSCPRCHPAPGPRRRTGGPARGLLLAVCGVGGCAGIGFQVVWTLAGESPTEPRVLALLALVPVLVGIALGLAWLPRIARRGAAGPGDAPAAGPAAPRDARDRAAAPSGGAGSHGPRPAAAAPPRGAPIARITPRPSPAPFALCAACNLEHPRRSNWRCPRCGAIVS